MPPAVKGTVSFPGKQGRRSTVRSACWKDTRYNIEPLSGNALFLDQASICVTPAPHSFRQLQMYLLWAHEEFNI